MPKAFLQIVAGPKTGSNVAIGHREPLVIGRKRGDLVLEDPLVSGTHARIFERDGQLVLQDLGSTNGTTVDGRPVREATLRAGAEISIGANKLILFIGDELPSNAPDPAAAAPQLDIAWLLDEELVELKTGSYYSRHSV